MGKKDVSIASDKKEFLEAEAERKRASVDRPLARTTIISTTTIKLYS